MLRRAGLIAASLLVLACASHADEIYKWVDKEGKTHYSSRKEDAAGAAITTMPSKAPPPINAAAPPAAQSANEEIIRRPAAGVYEPKYAQPPVMEKPVTRNYASEANTAKCQLARDILSGQAKHHNGAAIDAYDRQIAESDVRTFCAK